jgi:hypothetical protein
LPILRFVEVKSTDIGDIKGAAIGGQKRYKRTGFHKGNYPPIPSAT